MANEITQALKNTATKIGEILNNVSTMKVTTQYKLVEDTTTGPQVVAETVVSIDGDSTNMVPMTKNNTTNGFVVDQELYEIHKANVATAIEYRARMAAALLNALQSLKGS